MFKINNLKLVGIILGILAIGAIYSVVEEDKSSSSPFTAARVRNVDNKITTEQPAQKEVAYAIDKGDENIKSYQMHGY